MLSLIVDPSLSYPEGNDLYSPDERFPEYRHAHLSRRRNPVYRTVRDCLAQAGLDREHLGTASWNPLGRYVGPGSRVFVLCNLVLHRQPGETAETLAAKCVHGSVLRPLIDYLLLAVGEGGSIAFGNAPMQHCDWGSVLAETGARTVCDYYHSLGAPVEVSDLRLFAVQRSRIGRVTRVERRPEADGVAVDLGPDSLMVELDRQLTSPYRVMNYDPRRLEAFHSGGKHVYVINRQVLAADVVVHLSKLKTHEKVGITCALKSTVGAAGHKDSLPHYRHGTPDVGGDEFPSVRTGILGSALAFHHYAQTTDPESVWGNMLRVTDRLLRVGIRRWTPITEGGWWGNDTAWRMVLDLARILAYADANGRMQPTPCRRNLAFIDGIIGGEGSGPLNPRPVHTGLLMLGDNQVSVDFACALMMGFHPGRMPMLREALTLCKHPLIDRSLADEQVRYNGRPSSVSALSSLATHHFEPPPGWKGKL